MQLYDFSECPLSAKNGMYGGMAGLKDGIIFHGENYLIKYPKSTAGMKNVPISYTTAPLNEYIGSHIYGELGLDVHKTLLGKRNGKLVVACKDFETDGKRLLEIRTIKNYANESLAEKLDRDFAGTGSKHFVNFNELYLHIKNNDILLNVPGLEDRFWNMVIVDLYIRNGDRNDGNWGLLRDKDGHDTLAPIYDNGGCFTDKADDAKFARLLSKDALRESALNFRTSYGVESVPGDPSSVKQLSAVGFIEKARQYKGFNEALKRIVPKIQERTQAIHDIINQIPDSGLGLQICTQNQKNYLIRSCDIRLHEMLEPALQHTINHNTEQKIPSSIFARIKSVDAIQAKDNQSKEIIDNKRSTPKKEKEV